MKKKSVKIFSEEEIERIINSGKKEEVDEITYFKNLQNLQDGECYSCMKYNSCEYSDEYGGKCPDWEMFLTCKDIQIKKNKEIIELGRI